MPSEAQQRYQFIGHALRGDGPFRPWNAEAQPIGSVASTAWRANESYLVRYPRESNAKYDRRNEIAFFASPLARAASRFAGYISTRAPQREIAVPLYKVIADDADAKGNAIDVFWQSFMMDFKARGAMLLLVNMPAELGSNQAQQLQQRKAPYWSPIAPEQVSDYAMGEDGKLEWIEFPGLFKKPDGKEVKCTWRVDDAEFVATEEKGAELARIAHPLNECPVLVASETGRFPCFGPFSAIADLSRRLFNLDSELDEILRAQTFSLLTMEVPAESTDDQKLAAARVAGEAIGTHNLLVHSGATPAFIAPPDGPATIYLKRIEAIEKRIDEIGLNVASESQLESGLARRLRFQTVNAELSRFSGRMEDLERRAWELTRRWLGLQAVPTTQWPRDFNLADVEQELLILTEMQGAGMPAPVIAEQQRRVVAVHFVGLDAERADEIEQAIEERLLERAAAGDVDPPDPLKGPPP